MVFGTITPISNACAINKTADIHKKNKVAPFIKVIFLLFACKFFLMKTIFEMINDKYYYSIEALCLVLYALCLKLNLIIFPNDENTKNLALAS